MKKVIDSCNSLTGWTVSAPSVIAQNDFPQYVAGLNEFSILTRFDAEDAIRTLSKSLGPVDVSGYETLVLSCHSRDNGKTDYTDQVFWYKIRINATTEFYLPVKDTFTNVDIAIDSVDEIDRIEITAMTDGVDFLWLSEIVVEKQQVMLDTMLAAKAHIEYELNKLAGDGVKVGTASFTAGDRDVTIGNFAYLEQYSVVKITDGVNSELHQVDDKGANGEFRFMPTFDGEQILNNYTDADVYVTFPVSLNPDEREIRIPGVVVWAFTPTPVYRTGKLDSKIDAYNVDGSFVETTEGQLLMVDIQVDCEARQASLLDIASRAVRQWAEKEITWINGRFHETFWNEAPTEIQPPTGIDIIPKMQYTISIELEERFAGRRTLSAAGSPDLTFSQEVSGG